MNILALILHLKSAIGFGTDISVIVKDLFESKKLPSQSELENLISDLLSLLTGGVLNVFPPDEAQKVVAILGLIKNGAIPVVNEVENVVSDIEKKSPIKPDILNLVNTLEGLLQDQDIHTFLSQDASDKVKSILEAIKAGVSVV